MNFRPVERHYFSLDQDCAAESMKIRAEKEELTCSTTTATTGTKTRRRQAAKTSTAPRAISLADYAGIPTPRGDDVVLLLSETRRPSACAQSAQEGGPCITVENNGDLNISSLVNILEVIAKRRYEESESGRFSSSGETDNAWSFERETVKVLRSESGTETAG
ncbi:hypothetical protein BC826DRAFT_1003204, partial [Russula brevipes]